MGVYIDCRHVGRLLEDVGLFRLPGLGNSFVAVRCLEKSGSSRQTSRHFLTLLLVAAATLNLSELFFFNSHLIIPRIYLRTLLLFYPTKQLHVAVQYLPIGADRQGCSRTQIACLSSE